MKTPISSPSRPRILEGHAPPVRRLFAEPASAPCTSSQGAGWESVDKLLIEASPDSVGLISSVARERGLTVGPALHEVVKAAARLGTPGNAQQKQFERMVQAGREEVRARLPLNKPQ